MVEFLIKHKAEVMSMCLTEFDEEVFAEVMKEEGKIQDRIESIFELLGDYGEIPEMLRKRVMEKTDLEILKKWHKIAARAESIEAFGEKAGLIRENLN